MSLPESKVLETLNKVSTAQRIARLVGSLFYSKQNMTDNGLQDLQDSDFGKREEIRRTKEARRNAKRRTTADS